jgi:ketosteroid isomerase-like protein
MCLLAKLRSAREETSKETYYMSEENLEVVRKAYEAFGQGDLPTVFDLLDPEVVFYQSELLPWGGRREGHEGMRSFLEDLTSATESQVKPDEFVEAGDHVVAVGRTRGRVRATGEEFDVRAVHVWTLKEGKVVRFEAYIDTPKMRDALDL